MKNTQIKTTSPMKKNMKKLLTTLLVMVSAVAVQAKTVSAQNIKIAPSEVSQVIRLVEKNQDGSSQKKVSIIVTDLGLSTDVSPRYSVYLGFASLAEMGNIKADFKINGEAIEFISASRKAAGIYEVKVMEYREDGMNEVTLEIDATQMFADERNLRKNCGSDFCDQALATKISVKENARKILN